MQIVVKPEEIRISTSKNYKVLLVPFHDSIKVDGRLWESMWDKAIPIGPLTMAEPDEGVPPNKKDYCHELFTHAVWDQNGQIQQWRIFTALFNWRLESGDRFEFNIVLQMERIPELN